MTRPTSSQVKYDDYDNLDQTVIVMLCLIVIINMRINMITRGRGVNMCFSWVEYDYANDLC